MNRMKHLHIALLAGGDSSEREIALQSAAQVAEALVSDKYDVTLIDLHGSDWHHTASDGRTWQIDKNDFSLTIDGRKTLFDYAVILIHGTPGENGRLQGYLDMMGVTYSCCPMTSAVLTFDKITTKRTLAGTGIRLAPDLLLAAGEQADAEAVVERLGLPLFVKPNASGSSFGVTKVCSREQLATAVATARRESDEVLIESCIEGREIGCGVLIAGGREYLFPVTEIIPRNAFFDFQAKYTAGCSEEITPADLPEETRRKLNRLTLTAYRACRCRGVVRVDFILPSNGEPCLIEINAIPGMSTGSIVPKQVRAMGMSIGELYDLIIEDTYIPRR